jgi:hypothetical protein
MDKVHLTADQHTMTSLTGTVWTASSTSNVCCKTTTAGQAANAHELLDNWAESRLVSGVPEREFRKRALLGAEGRLEASTETTHSQAAANQSRREAVAAK